MATEAKGDQLCCVSRFVNMREGKFHTTKPFSKEEKRAAIELRKANVPLKTIRQQLNISERSIHCILSFAKENPHKPIAGRKPGSGRPSPTTPQLQEVIEREGGTTKY